MIQSSHFAQIPFARSLPPFSTLVAATVFYSCAVAATVFAATVFYSGNALDAPNETDESQELTYVDIDTFREHY